LKDPDPKKSQRVMQALMQMTKLDIARLQQAAESETSSFLSATLFGGHMPV